MKNKFLLVFLFSCCFFPFLLNAQSIGDYRSANTGNWSSAGTWETYNGLLWMPAITPPSSLLSGAINIRNGHIVTVSTNIVADQITINAGGTLNLASNT